MARNRFDVQYSTGRLIDFQAFYDKLKNDDPDIDVSKLLGLLDQIHHQLAYGDQIQHLTTLVTSLNEIQNC